MRRLLCPAVWLGALALACAACTPPTEQENNPDLPLLTALTLDGQAADNERVLLFSVDFRDADRDLAAGDFAPLINGAPAVQNALPLAPVFLRSGLAADARAGRMQFELEIAIPDDDPPRAGSTFTVGILAHDGAGHASNQPQVTLEISY
ncbi:MAG: hypothetical protein HY904_02885 [Deltaproteobacteria bacterium]|nr:hypothetical protein [Deltaproteobacteria bacterium]